MLKRMLNMCCLLLWVVALSCAAFPYVTVAADGSPAGSSMITMDYARYLAPIDLHFTKPTKPIESEIRMESR